MKKAKILIAAMFMAATLGLPATAVFAATITLTQADFEAACTTPDVMTAKGIRCDTTDSYYAIKAGDYTLGGNVDIDTYSILLTDDSGNYNINLGGFTLSGAVDNYDDYLIILQNGAKTNTISNGKIINDGDATALGTGGANTTLSDISITSNSNTLYVGAGATDDAGSVILNNVTSTGAVSVGEESTLVINSGSYVGTGYGPAASTDYMTGGNLIINGGTFTADDASAVYANGPGTSGSVIVNGGTFTSAGDTGLEILGAKTVRINGGTFKGARAGLGVTEYNTVILAGGTYTATGSDNMAGAIQMYDVDKAAALLGLLADGYKYQNGSADYFEDAGFGMAYLTQKTDSVVSESTPEEETATDTSDTSSSSTIGTPNSGRATAAGSATASFAASAIATSAILGITYGTKKHLAKARKN
ncbi:hypothetical protein IJG78_03555 [Candidatus Saccharibacteria bacterium]|nr:hypothetical protein [Candidatus Saccharibacteria bacterium]